MKTKYKIPIIIATALVVAIWFAYYATSENFDYEAWQEKRSLFMDSYGLHHLSIEEREDFIIKYTDAIHSGEFHSQVYITDLQKEYAAGEPITFTVATWGYEHPCQSPSFTFYYETKDPANIVFEDEYHRLCQVLQESDYTYYYDELGSNQTNKATNYDIYPVFDKPGNYLIIIDGTNQYTFSIKPVLDDDFYNDPITIDDIKQEILTQLRKGPQNVNGTAKEFLVSEALADQRVWDLLKDTTYQVNCCTYTLDGNEYPYPLYIGITFQLNEKDMYVTVEYDLQQEKITGVETQEGIRTGGIMPI